MNFRNPLTRILLVGKFLTCLAFGESFQQLKDINTVPFESSSSPQFFKTSGPSSFFVASTVEHGSELWITTGTEAGTRLVKDINLGAPSSGITSVSTFLNGTFLFFADDGIHGRELWRSDGTTEGTYMVKDIWPGTISSSSGSIAVMGEYAYFSANDGIHGSELWKTDGTTAGTVMVRDINPGAGGSGPSSLVTFGASVYFSAYDPATGTELWKTDGTHAGTVLVKDIFPGGGSSLVEQLTVAGSNLFFVALDGTTPGRNLWKTNGTTAGTVMVKNIDANPGGLSPMRHLTAVGNDLYFFAQTVANGWELWKSNGSTAGTFMIELIAGSGSGAFAASSSQISALGSAAYFIGSNGAGQTGIWKTNGTTTSFMSNVSSSSNSAPGVVLGANLYLQIGTQLWRTSGTPAGTTAIYDGTLTLAGAPVLLGSSLLFSASVPIGMPGAVGTELYRSNGQNGNFGLVRNISTGTSSSAPVGFVRAGGRVFFTANDGIHGVELWSTDGTAAGTSLAKDIRPGTPGIGIVRQIAVGNRVYFPASDGIHGVELWCSDGTEAGTFLVADIRPGADSSMDTSYAPLGAIGELVFFRANDGIHGEELWVTDGTEAGTRMVKDINPGTDGSLVGAQGGVRLGDALYFAAYSVDSGWELWRSDGTTDGTFLVADISPGTGSSLSGSYATHPFGVVVDGLIYFSAFDASHGRELWVSDGTAAGTRLVSDIRGGAFGALDPVLRAVPFDGGICFPANDGASGIELWFSDGTNAGTKLVGDIQPGASSSNPVAGVVCGGVYYFIATDTVSGTELWRWDGGNAAPSRVIDLAPGAGSPGIQHLACGGGRLYFAADPGGASARQLWSSDGTGAGTFMISNNLPGHPALPQEMTVLDGRLVFSAQYPFLDRELAAYVLPAPDLVIEYPVGTPILSGAALINFGEVTQGAPPGVRTIRVANAGTDRLTGLEVEFVGSNADDFTVLPPGLPSTLEPGSDSTIDVAFAPRAEGTRSATLRVASNDPDDSPFLIGLEGIGAPPPVFTWSGLGADDQWSTPGNWVDGLAPPQDGSAWVVFGESPRRNPVVDQAWNVYGIELGGTTYEMRTFTGVALGIGQGGVVETGTETRFTFFNLNVTLTADQAWSKAGANTILPRCGTGWTLDTNGHELTIGAGFFGNSEFPGEITGTGSLVIDSSGYFIARGPLSLAGGIRVETSGQLTVYDITYPGIIHGDNASILEFSGSASGEFLPQITGSFSQVQLYNSPPLRTLSLMQSSTVSAGHFWGLGGVRLELGDDAVFGSSYNFSAGGVIGAGVVLEAVGGPRVFPQRFNRLYAAGLTVNGPNAISFEGGASLGGYPGETSIIEVTDANGLLRLSGVATGSHSFPMEKRGPGTLELGGAGNNNLTLPFHVREGRLVLNKTSQPGGVTAFSGNLRIGDGAGVGELVLLNSNQIADSATVTLDSGGTFDLAGKQETVARLEGSGSVGNSSTSANSTLTVAVPNGQTCIFSGSLVNSLGSGSRTLAFKMAGQGVMVLDGSSSLSGVQVEAGTLQIDGQLSSASATHYVVNTGTLAGTGQISGMVLVAGSGAGAVVSPGPGIATLTIGKGLEFQGSNQTFEVEINSTLGTSDRLQVNDFVDLGSGTTTLALADVQPAAMGSGGFVIIENTSFQETRGHFSGLSEGALVTVGPNTFAITYQGGPGNNDVMLVQAPTPQPRIQLELPDGTVLGENPILDFGLQLGNPEFSPTIFFTDRTIVIRNAGDAPLTLQTADATIDSMSGKYHFLVVDAPFDDVLAPGQARSLTIRFQPVAGTTFSVNVNLRIYSSDPGDPIRYASLSGSIVSHTPIESAMQDAGLTGQNAEPGAIPFGDGVPNLIKYAFNMNLGGPDSTTMTSGTGTSGLPSVGLVTQDGETLFRIEYLQRKGASLNYEPQVSSDLDDFGPMVGTTTIENVDLYWQRVVVRQPVDPGTQHKWFGRVMVTP
jgi:ELWxxDGT repeat protein